MSTGEAALGVALAGVSDRVTDLEGIVPVPADPGDDGKVLTASAGSGEWQAPAGTTDHAALSNLAYASAGHTGFVPATRQVGTAAGSGLGGGGALSGDLALVLDVAGLTGDAAPLDSLELPAQLTGGGAREKVTRLALLAGRSGVSGLPAVPATDASTLARWLLNESSGPTFANDLNPGTYDLTATGTYQAAMVHPAGLALGLAGSNGDYLYGAKDCVPSGAAFTLHGWIWMDALVASRRIAVKSTNDPYAAPDWYSLSMRQTAAGGGVWEVVVNVGSAGAGNYKTITAAAARHYLKTGIWHHVAVTADATTARLYLDGAEVGNVATGAAIYWNSSPNRGYWYLGNEAGLGSTSTACRLRDWRPEQVVRTADEIRGLYRCGLGYRQAA